MLSPLISMASPGLCWILIAAFDFQLYGTIIVSDFTTNSDANKGADIIIGAIYLNKITGPKITVRNNPTYNEMGNAIVRLYWAMEDRISNINIQKYNLGLYKMLNRMLSLKPIFQFESPYNVSGPNK